MCGLAMDWRKFVFGNLNWRRMVWSVLLLYLFFVFLGVFVSERMMFPYRGCSYDAGLPGLEMLETPDGVTLATRFLKSANEKYLALYFHGNYEDLGHLDAIAERLHAEGFSVLAMDYRGYGLSGGGRPTERRCYQDALTLYEEALNRGYAPGKIVAWGRSIGSGPAVHLAYRREVRGLVLEAPFTSAFRVACRIPFLPFDRFPNLRKVADLEVPMFILHGSRDRVVPAWHSARLEQRHPGKRERFVLEGGTHNDIWSFPLDREFQALKDLLAEAAQR
jgi:hypothetical protein